MDKSVKLILAKKLLDKCGCPPGHSIYALIPEIYGNYNGEVYSHSLPLKPKLLESTFALFHNKETLIAKSSPLFMHVKENQEKMLELISYNDALLGKEEIEKRGTDEISAILSMLFSSYLDSFVKPIQFFLPLSPSCAGQWKLWEQVDYFKLLQAGADKERQFEFRERVTKNPIWKLELQPLDFTPAVRNAIAKRGMFGKRLESEAMIKAIIIRMGEMSSPSINYETIDYAMRSMFTHLKFDKYLRVDREIEFLKRLEEVLREEMVSCFK